MTRSHDHATDARPADAVNVTILACRADEAREALAKLARRGKRLGQTISWAETARVEQRGTRRVRNPDYGKPDGVNPMQLMVEQPIMVEVLDLAITGEAPKVADFTLEAALERTDGGVIVSAAPTTTRSAGKLGREWDGRCEHCGSNRARVHGYIVSKGRNRKVVGRSCLRDYLGCDAPASIAARFNFLRDLAGLGDDDSWGCYGSRLNVVDDLLVTARACIKLYGWRPASYDGQTTAAQVWLTDRIVFGKGEDDLRKQKAEILAEIRANEETYRTEAAAIVDWARNLRPGHNDYLHNLKVALASDAVRAKHTNLVISAAAAWDKQVAREAERAAEQARKAAEDTLPPSEWLGTVGERITAEVAFISSRVLPDYGYGELVLYKFRMATGQFLTWKTAARPELRGAQPQQAFTLTGTVKRHSEFREVKETALSRCKVAALAEAA